jgi:hypothetical protein
VRFRIIDGCPCPETIAPYVYIVLREANQTASSIYRGRDARALLHRHGKHDQAEIHEMYPAISNPPGRSQHELRSDGHANRGPVGRRIEEWEIGVDSGTDDAQAKARVEAAARKHGWHVRHPYTRGVEGHHWCFDSQPKPRNRRQRIRIIWLRARLPRR